MNEQFLEFVIFLYEAVGDIDSIMQGNLKVFNTEDKNDAIHKALTEDLLQNDIVAVYLKVMLPVIAECAKKLYAHHLPGGVWTVSII